MQKVMRDERTMMLELRQINDETGAEEMKHCTVLIESEIVMVSRRIPVDLLENIGFFEWNRFCDRLDRCLEPLRRLAEEETKDPGMVKEEAAKTDALQSLQQACDKLSSHNPWIQCTLYCPFHSELVANWHIQVTYAAHPESIASRDQSPISVSNDSALAPRSEERQGVEAAAAEVLPLETTALRDASSGNGNVPSADPTVAVRPLSSRKAAVFHTNPGPGVLGVDYIEHIVHPEDTLSGICLAYNVSSSRLKQANHLSGDNESLLLAPHKILAIPVSEGFYARVKDTDSEDYKVNFMRNHFPKLSIKEATAYLELADWVLLDALTSVREDIEWEKAAKDEFF